MEETQPAEKHQGKEPRNFFVRYKKLVIIVILLVASVGIPHVWSVMCMSTYSGAQREAAKAITEAILHEKSLNRYMAPWITIESISPNPKKPEETPDSCASSNKNDPAHYIVEYSQRTLFGVALDNSRRSASFYGMCGLE